MPTRARALAIAAGLLLAGLLATTSALAQQAAKGFDHLTTGFALTGQHRIARCEDCHVRGIFKGTPTQCAACHLPGTPVTAVIMASNHFPTSQPCSSCHTTSSFYGAFFPHTDVAAGTCTNCHNSIFAQGKPAGHLVTNFSCDRCHSTVSFSSAYLTLPLGHIPTAQPCSTCHNTAAFVPGVMNHASTAGTCAQCHAASTAPYTFTIAGALTTSGAPVTVIPTSQGGLNATNTGSPVNHIPTVASCDQCHTNGIFTAGGFRGGVMHHAAVAGQPCAGCHNNPTTFAGTGLGAGGQPFQIPGPVGTPGASDHIPINALDCGNSGCHSASDTTTATGTGFATHLTPALSAAGHQAVNLPCQSCHSVGMSWKLDSTSMVTPAPAHIPPDNTSGSLGCSSCHSATSFGTGGFHLSGTPGSAPVMTVAMHAAVAAAVPACVSCHEANAGDLGFQGILGQIYLRPNTATSGLSLASDAAHGAGNALTGDCGSCHSTSAPFRGGTLPANHIKLITPTPSCSDCHAGGYAPGVTTMKHADAAGTCTSCHYTSTVFSGSGQGINGQPWQIPGSVGTPGAGNHIPINGVDCAAGGCHTVSDTMSSTGAGFVLSGAPVLSAAGHAALGLACETCHTINMAWKLPAGVTLVTPAANHIPPDNTPANGVPCSACHLSTNIVMGGFHLNGTAGTSSPVMTVAMHSAVASAVPACASCHEANSANLGFQGILGQIYLRPNTATPGLSQASDPSHTGTAATADCSGCHSTTPPFSNATSRPVGHIAVASTASCATCHTTGLFNTVVLPMPHSGVVSGTCGSCHGSGLASSGYLGPFAGPSTLGGSYTPGNILFVPKQIISSPAIGASGGHILPPSADDCSVCHLSTSAFGPGTAMVHTNISSGCASCHSNGAVWYGVSSTATMLVTTGGRVLSPLHVPVAGATNTACEMCHSTTVFTSFSGTRVNHTSGQFMTFTARTSATPTCKSCHGPSGATWYGVSLSTATVGSHQGSTSSQDCINCHSTSDFGGAAAAAVAKRPFFRMSNGPAMRPAASGLTTVGGAANLNLAAPFTHIGVVPGTCTSCHSASGAAPALPANHLPTALSCDGCHRTSSWLPAIFAHSGVAVGICATCHMGSWATAKPAAHMLTSRTCDTCHRGTSSWTPQTYSHLDTVYTPHPSNVRCIDCHATNTEQVAWKYPNLKPACAGCHGTQFGGTATIRRSKGPAVPQPRGPQ